MWQRTLRKAPDGVIDLECDKAIVEPEPKPKEKPKKDSQKFETPQKASNRRSDDVGSSTPPPDRAADSPPTPEWVKMAHSQKARYMWKGWRWPPM